MLTGPESHYSKSFVNNNRQVTLKAFVGKNGQEEYETTLLFGPQALSSYARDLSIQECVPLAEDGWFYIDTKTKKIEVHLK